MADSPHAVARTTTLDLPYLLPQPSPTIAWSPWARTVVKRSLADLLDALPRELGSSDVAVLCALWCWTTREGVAWPSLESIAARAHVSRRTAVAAVARLEAAGFVTRRSPVHRRTHETTTYMLPTPGDAVATVERSDAPEATDTTDAGPAPSPPVGAPPAPAREPGRPDARPEAPSPSLASREPGRPEAPAVEPGRLEAPALPPGSGATGGRDQVQPLHSKGTQGKGNQNAHARVPPQPWLRGLPRAERSRLNRESWRAKIWPPAKPAPTQPRAVAALVATLDAGARERSLDVLRAWRQTALPLPDAKKGTGGAPDA